MVSDTSMNIQVSEMRIGGEPNNETTLDISDTEGETVTQDDKMLRSDHSVDGNLTMNSTRRITRKETKRTSV